MNDKLMPVLSVKLKMPEPRKNYVVRKRLFEKLKKIDEYKISVIKGGAGSGKTTLLSSFIKEEQFQNVKWVSLDENVNEVFTFWKYISEALLEYLGDEGESFRNSFDGNIQKENIITILSLFINSISTNDEIFLVLDDFHLISDEFLISTIDFFIQNMPINMHIILLTREVPKIYLGNLIIDDQAFLLDEEDIKFNKIESIKFLTETLKLEKDESILDKLVESSAGWIGGLQLIAIASKSNKSPLNMKLKSDDIGENFRIESSVINDYITKEIFNDLSKAEQDFLIKISILRYFNEKICNKFLPEYNFKVLLESILEKNLFVISIDEKKGVYKFHAILSKYLNRYFEEPFIDSNYNLEEKNRLHNLAADIYLEIGDNEEALYHLFAANNYDKIMKVLLKMPQNSVTYAYILKVPLIQISKNSDFAYQYFFCQYASMNVNACRDTYNFIVSNMKSEKSLDGFKHVDAFLDAKFDFTKVKVLEINQIQKFNINKITKAYLLIKEGYFLFAKGKNKEAMEYIDHAEKTYKETKSIYIGFFIFAEKTQILENLGEFEKCLEIYEEMSKYLERVPSLAASYYVGIAGVYIKRLELSKAKKCLDNVKKYVSSDQINLANAYNFTLAEYLYTCSDISECEKIIKNIFSKENYEVIIYGARLLRYPIFREQNKDLAKEFAAQCEDLNILNMPMDSQMLFARIIYDEGRKDEALEIAKNIISTARKEQNKLKIVEVNLLKMGFMLNEACSERDIKNLFLEALSYAVDDKILHPFWYEKDLVFEVIKKYKKSITENLSQKEKKFLDSMLKVIAEPAFLNSNFNSSAVNKADTSNEYDLTERELEVLGELSKGYTNKEIAEKLFITLATVKTHIINIYGKLGVNNRMQAINKYLEMK